MCVCMCMCMCMRMFTWMYIQVLSMHTWWIYTQIHVHVCAHVYVHANACGERVVIISAVGLKASLIAVYFDMYKCTCRAVNMCTFMCTIWVCTMYVPAIRVYTRVHDFWEDKVLVCDYVCTIYVRYKYFACAHAHTLTYKHAHAYQNWCSCTYICRFVGRFNAGM